MSGALRLRTVRRAAGAILLALCFLPVHHLLDPRRAGPAGNATVAIVDADLSLVRLGTLLVLALAVVLEATVPVRRLTGPLARAGRWLSRPGGRSWAAALGLLSLGLGVGVALGVHRGLPRLLDEMAQLLNARVLATGALARPFPGAGGGVGTAPGGGTAAAFLIQNSALTPAGWTSVYPPGHTALLAMGLLVHAPWAVGPVLLALTVVLTWRALDRLYPHRPATVRLASLAVAASPFLLLLGSGYLSHVSAAAAGAAAFWTSVEAWKGRARWAVPAGACLGFMVCSRPWIGLTLGGFLVFGTLGGAWWREGRTMGWLGRRLALVAAGGAPFAAALFAYDRRLFGRATRLGYDVAFGPAHGLGFHPDPWGNLYGLREAVGYTAADLSTLGLHLLETPLPAVAVVALFLLLARRISFPTWLLLGWALVPVAADTLYWHHGQHMGPRMLFEAAPAWAALAVVAAVALASGGGDPGLPGELAPHGRPSRVGGVVTWALLCSAAAGLALLVPARLGGAGWDPDALARSTLPEVPGATTGGSAVVFVHGTWANRVASRLVATGMRRDSVETALRRNDLCRVHLYAEARARGETPLPSLDLTPLPGTPATLRSVEVAPGVRVRLREGSLPAPCVRELEADRRGVVELAPLLWQLPFPGTGRILLARDLGPDGNRAILRDSPGAQAWVWSVPHPGAAPTLLPYEEGMRELWEPTPR